MRFREGRVTAVNDQRDGLVRCSVNVEGSELPAVAFPPIAVETGDRVIVNTTGIELQLGTGGVAFLLWNLDRDAAVAPARGHIMKLRYTPWQREVLTAESPESQYHDRLAARDSIDGMPVVACGLHSQVAAVAAGIKAARPRVHIGYLMTDAGALPIAWSDLVARLKGSGLLDVTCTVGHAFGGDLESVNVFSGLVALRHAAAADVVIVALGPGIVGTASKLGFSGIEQGQVLDAAAALQGPAIACLRISFTDARPRHRGVSHHSLTALQLAARERATVAVPHLPDEKATVVATQLEDAGIVGRHDIELADGDAAVRLLARRGVAVTSMGRRAEDVPELFLAAGAAGALAADRL